MTRSLITPLLVAVLALGAAGCGGSDDPDGAAATPPESTSSTEAVDGPSESESSTAPVAPSEVPSESAPVPGDEGEEGDDGSDGADDAAVISSMQFSLNALVDPKTSPQQKADRIVGGRDLASVFEQFQQGSSDSQLVFSVAEPEVQGRRATALVGASDRGRQYAAPARTPFVLKDGEWRLERSTVCAFAEQAGLRCPRR